MKKLLFMGLVALMVVVSGCKSEAQIAADNTSKDADNFEINRRIVFYNGITGQYVLSIEGLCSIEDNGRQLKVTCKTGNSEYKKHYLGLSDNLSYFAEQLAPHKTSGFYYKVNFRPESIIPELNIKTSANAVVPENEGGVK